MTKKKDGLLVYWSGDAWEILNEEVPTGTLVGQWYAPGTVTLLGRVPNLRPVSVPWYKRLMSHIRRDKCN